jgi:hypothetical protein
LGRSYSRGRRSFLRGCLEGRYGPLFHISGSIPRIAALEAFAIRLQPRRGSILVKIDLPLYAEQADLLFPIVPV